VCVEKWENLFGASTSFERNKQQRTSSLSSLLPTTPTSSLSSLHPTTPTFARTFQSSSQPTGAISRLAVNKSVSECNLAQWVGRPSQGGQAAAGAQELGLITDYLGIRRAGRSTSLGPDTTRTSVPDRGVCVSRHEAAPLYEGLFYATPVLLADASESDGSDTDTDAQTVIHTSPYSSHGGLLSRSASAVLTPVPPSPLTLPSPDSPPPPPRPPPPLHYTPSRFSSLPRNWGGRSVET